jgi:mono/diheme cytochrome c family protein
MPSGSSPGLILLLSSLPIFAPLRFQAELRGLGGDVIHAAGSNKDAGMRILFVIIASLSILWPWLPTAALAEPPTSAGKASPQANAEASPNDIDGEQMFATTCGFCHQDGGRAAGRGPKLSKSERSDEFIIERIKKGKVGAMPAFGSVFSDGQIIAILAYIRGLDD